MKALRKRATIARRAIRQVGEALEAFGRLPPDWQRLVAETADLVVAARPTTRLEELALAVKSRDSWMSERRITAAMLEVRDRADGFARLPAREARPDRFLSAFQEAEPYLHLPIRAYKPVTWLVKQTRPGDWQSGSRPIVWPTRRRQCELLGISPGQVKLLNRALFAPGILVIRDVAGRAANGNEARYGLDLTPLVQRYAEFERLAQTADRERVRVELLRQRAPVAARAFRQPVRRWLG
jgi:hypothetical protein